MMPVLTAQPEAGLVPVTSATGVTASGHCGVCGKVTVLDSRALAIQSVTLLGPLLLLPRWVCGPGQPAGGCTGRDRAVSGCGPWPRLGPSLWMAAYRDSESTYPPLSQLGLSPSGPIK
jgi:hypothetical protein